MTKLTDQGVCGICGRPPKARSEYSMDLLEECRDQDGSKLLLGKLCMKQANKAGAISRDDEGVATVDFRPWAVYLRKLQVATANGEVRRTSRRRRR